ncbi:MAG TPA: hypothetical protein VGG12_02805, partial [Methylovirgula sp.]
RQNLKECWQAGIFTEVNWVIGVPGETDADCDEGVDLILENQKYIGRLANINPLILVNGSVYWIDPERHGIRFRSPQEELYEKYPRRLPADTWYSVDPYIDGPVRKQRFEKIVLRLHESGFKLGAWAERVVEDVKTARDRGRATGSYKPELSASGEEPELIETLATHKIWFYKKQCYAVPLALGDVDLKQPETASLPGVLAADDETVLRVELEHSKNWANSRGQYDAQERQRIAGSLYRAGSMIGEEQKQVVTIKNATIIKLNGEFVAFDRDKLARPGRARRRGPIYRRIAETVVPKQVLREIRSLWPSHQEAVASPAGRATPLKIVRAFASSMRPRAPEGDGFSIPGTTLVARRATSKGVQPTLLTTIGRYQLFEYDGMFYGLPKGFDFDWDDPNDARQPGVIVSESAQKVMTTMRARAKNQGRQQHAVRTERGSGPAGEADKVPQLLGTIEDYNIISYEGVIYGLPQALGPIDLTQTDVIEMPGVIRDVSRQVVENEIQDLIAMRQRAAE